MVIIIRIKLFSVRKDVNSTILEQSSNNVMVFFFFYEENTFVLVLFY